MDIKQFQDSNLFVSQDGRFFREVRPVGRSNLLRSKKRTFLAHRVYAALYLPEFDYERDGLMFVDGNHQNFTPSNLLITSRRGRRPVVPGAEITRKDLELPMQPKVPPAKILECYRAVPDPELVADALGVSVETVKEVVDGAGNLVS